MDDPARLRNLGPAAPVRLLHLMGGLEVGGKERVVLQLARRARRDGLDHRILLFDTPFRSEELDFPPGEIPTQFIARSPGLDWKLPRQIGRLLTRERIQIVHAHNDTAIFYAALAVGPLRPRSKLIGTFHARPTHATPRARFLTRWATRRADCVTAVSEELGEELARIGWTTPCRTIWNGVDLHEFRPNGPDGGWRARLSIPRSATLVANVGRCVEVKRQGDLIDAARTLKARAPDVHFVLVGEGPMRADLQRAAADLPHVHFVPRITDVAAFLREVDIFVLCSEHEAAPRVLLETMAAARAIVATDVGGIRTMLSGPDGSVAGVLVPTRDVAALSGAIARLASDPAQRYGAGAVAQRAVQRFSAATEWREYRGLYEEILAPRAK